MPPKVNLQVKRSVASSNIIGFKFKLTSFEDGVNFENFRIVMYATHRWQQADFSCDTQLGYEVYNGASAVHRLGDISSLTHDAPAHPQSIKPGAIFRDMVRVRFILESGSNILNAGQAIGGAEITLRNSGYREYEKSNSGQRIYEASYSYTSSAEYVDSHRFVLEWNSVDPSNHSSQNWSVVTEYSSASTLDGETGAHPYEGDTGSAYASTNSDHLFVQASTCVLIDEFNHSTPFASSETAQLLTHYWSGSGYTNARVMLGYDLSTIAGHNVISAANLWWNEPADCSGAETINIHQSTAPFTELSTWDTHYDKLGDIQGHWTGFENPASIQNTIGVSPMSISYLQSVVKSEDHNAYLIMKFAAEGDATFRRHTISTRLKADATKRPYILVCFDPNDYSNRGDGDAWIPPIVVSGEGSKSAGGNGLLTYPALSVVGSGSIDSTISGRGNIALPRFSVSGYGARHNEVDGHGEIRIPSFRVSGLGAQGDAHFIASIERDSGRWDEVITMRIANIKSDTYLTLDGVELPFISVDGETVKWIVPRIPIGPRVLKLRRRSENS